MPLVDLNKLKAEFSRVVWVHDVDGDIANGLLARAEAVDVVEVVHGEWINGEDDGLNTCSVCKEYSEYATRFCCNCGAKMDGEK